MFCRFSPAIDILPFVVKYTCPFSVSAFDCSLLIPVKLSTKYISPSISFFKPNSPEHPNLINDVVPVPGRLQFKGQQSVQFLSHINDTSCHRPNISFPFLEQSRIIQNQ
jgi:hypothetical protein